MNQNFESSRALPRGTLVGNQYIIEKVLGEGGFGITYLATDVYNSTRLAVKEYMPRDAAYRVPGTRDVLPQGKDKLKLFESFREKFLEEARLLHRFHNDPGIVNVMRLFAENNTAYFVMEYLEGEDLCKYLSHHPDRANWAHLENLFFQIAQALNRIHQENVIHCDISPDNILVLSDGTAKLLDFGAARNTLRSSIVSSFIVKKPGYTPPEQVTSNMRMGPWTDVYSFAATIYRCVTGHAPPSYDQRLINDRTQWPSDLGLSVPSMQWEAALKQAMCLRPNERYQTIPEFWQDLTESIPAPSHICLLARGGALDKRFFPIQGDLYIGTDPTRCQVVFPAGTPGVSRRHMCVWQTDGTVFVMDMGSTYGTGLRRGAAIQRLTPHLVYPVPPDGAICLPAGEQFLLSESIFRNS